MQILQKQTSAILFLVTHEHCFSFALFISDLVACAEPEICQKICGNPSGCSDIAYPKLVIELLPVGEQPEQKRPEGKTPAAVIQWGYIGLDGGVVRDSIQQMVIWDSQ